jgi:hypothetical protein
MEFRNNLVNQLELAYRFTDMLTSKVGINNIKLINSLNKKHNDDKYCASQEITDANAIMIEVFKSYFGFEPDIENIEVAKLINDAWSIAKKAEFFKPHILDQLF